MLVVALAIAAGTAWGGYHPGPSSGEASTLSFVGSVPELSVISSGATAPGGNTSGGGAAFSLTTGEGFAAGAAVGVVVGIILAWSWWKRRGPRTTLSQLGPSESDLSKMDEIHQRLLQHFNELSSLYTTLAAQTSDGPTLGTSSGASGGSEQDLMNATQQMQETQMGFNLQYLMLQENIQNDAREYAALSNLMKTKVDTMKNILDNTK